MKVDIEIIEVLSKNITIDSNSIDDAIDIIKEMYKQEKIVLDYSDLVDVSFKYKNDKFDNRKDCLINKIIEYYINDERKHYEELDKPENHIYLSLKELKEYI